jgi:Zn finger protein HypA/HybF involved in hydrogenase expression
MKRVAQAQDDKRLKDVEVRLGVLTWITGLQLALLLAVLWQGGFHPTNAEVNSPPLQW